MQTVADSPYGINIFLLRYCFYLFPDIADMERLGDADTRTGVPCRGAVGDGVLRFLFQRCAALSFLTEGDTEKKPLHHGEAARHGADADTRQGGETHQGTGGTAHGIEREDPLLRLIL